MSRKFLSLIARLLDDDRKYQQQKSSGKAAGSLKLLSAFLCVLLCSLSRNPWFTTSILTVLLLVLAMQPPRKILSVIKPTLIAVLLAALITLPAVFLGSPRTFTTVTMKTAESVMVLAMVNVSEGWKGIVQSAASLHLPDLFVMTFDTTIRYLHILGRFAARIAEAVSLRSVGRRGWKASVPAAGGLLGTVFLKSQRMAEANAEAMVCRCFDGTYRRVKKHRFNGADALIVALDILMTVLFIYMQTLI